jgi:3-hydroxymyristoyl/3-hydroxydecanoyl-(acyl carrier protein) dehydratase
LDNISNKLEQINSFFLLPIPEKIINSNPEPDVINLMFFQQDTVRELIWEKEGNYYLNKAAKIELQMKKVDKEKHELKFLADMNVSKEICQGHFEFFPMLPLAVLAQAMGQVGELLLLDMMNGKSKDTIPLVIRAGEVGMISQKSNRQFIVPEDKLLIVATYKSGKLGLHYISAEVFLNRNLISKMNDIVYAFVNIENFKI